ncbi:DUF2274 domain-containing protein [Paraburkholderia humisilvae]|uniref:DUF2274 domain-containing protein n=1 Tax=Paraburkholderia humisilvae TaxID=627669 RepID=A0A6J5EW89_9BURK|nr:DUF2274 domain-containing protein [Paraburkholderia humisilvae]CAB3770840.1 hypothetical protein LMG29542_06460 [Paraburkholderia humisilvae]
MKSPNDKQQRLLLPILKREPEKARLTVSLAADVNADLIEYRRAYHEMAGAEIPVDMLVEYVLSQHMKRDKAFQAWKATQSGLTE